MNIIKKLALSVLSVIVFIVFSELFFTALERITGNTLHAQLMRYNNCFEKDENTGYRLKAGFSGYCVTDEYGYYTFINSQGLRTADIKKFYTQQKTMQRYLFIGDSFTFGTGVDYDKTFTHLFEKNMKDPAVESLNAGVPGYRIGNYLEYYKSNAGLFGPDTVVICICIANDISPGVWRPSVTEDGYLTDRFRQNIESRNKLHFWSFNHSALYRKLTSINIDFSDFRKLGYHHKYYRAGDLRCLSKDYLKKEEAAEVYNEILSYCEDLSERIRAHQQDCLFVLLPFREQINEAAFRLKLETDGAVADEYDPLLPQKIFSDYFKKNKINYLDPSEQFKSAAAAGNKLFFDIDGHLTAKGHKIVAESIIDYFKR